QGGAHFLVAQVRPDPVPVTRQAVAARRLLQRWPLSPLDLASAISSEARPRVSPSDHRPCRRRNRAWRGVGGSLLQRSEYMRIAVSAASRVRSPIRCRTLRGRICPSTSICLGVGGPSRPSPSA